MGTSRCDRNLRRACMAPVLALVMLFPTFAQSQVPLDSSFTYQGRLLQNGVAVDGTYDLSFDLYSDADGANLLGSDCLNDVVIANGLISATLDFGPAFLAADKRWLGIKLRPDSGEACDPDIGSYVQLLPFQELTPAPQASYALEADGGSSTSAFDVMISNQRAFRVESGVDSGTSDFAPNVIGGVSLNGAGPTVAGATIGGGGTLNSPNSPLPNTVSDSFGTVGGGAGNQAGDSTDANDLDRFATVGGGSGNTASASLSTVSGGNGNTASGRWSTVAGGDTNTASGASSVVGGGDFNDATLTYSTIGGGRSNISRGQGSTVGGGIDNIADGFESVVSGGTNNSANDQYAAIVGGLNNVANGVNSSIGGGEGNNTTGTHSTVSGGSSNHAEGTQSTVGGGNANHSEGSYSAIGGGTINTASAGWATVAGGTQNNAAAQLAMVPGGAYNTAGGSSSFAAGYRAKVRTGTEVGGKDTDGDEGAFVWSDFSVDADFTSTGPNQFLIRAAGNVGIDTNNPTAQLTVNAGGAHGLQIINSSDIPWGIRLLNESSALSGAVPFEGGIYMTDEGTLRLTTNVRNFPRNYAELDSAGNWTATSDARRKTNMQPISHALEGILKLDPLRYFFKDDSGNAVGTRQIGLTAQDVESEFPELVRSTEDVKSLNYSGLGVVAIAALKELKAEKDAEIKALEEQNAELMNRLERIERLLKVPSE